MEWRWGCYCKLCASNDILKAQTITKASFPQNKNGYWSIIVCTISSKYGRICSNLPMSLNSIGSSVGHQQIARFLLSMLFSLEFSATLETHELKRIKSWGITASYFTKCWKINLRTSKLIRGNLSSIPRKASNLQLRSVFTSMLPVVVTIGLIRVPKNIYI